MQTVIIEFYLADATVRELAVLVNLCEKTGEFLNVRRLKTVLIDKIGIADTEKELKAVGDFVG